MVLANGSSMLFLVLDAVQCIHDYLKYCTCFPTLRHRYNCDTGARVAQYVRCLCSLHCALTIVCSFNASALSGIQAFFIHPVHFYIIQFDFSRRLMLLLFFEKFPASMQLTSRAGRILLMLMYNAAMLYAVIGLSSHVHLERIYVKLLLVFSMRSIQNSNLDKWKAHLCIPQSTRLGESGIQTNGANTQKKISLICIYMYKLLLL